MIIFTLLAIVILTGAVGDISVTRGMKAVGEISSFRLMTLISAAARMFQNGFLWLGLFCKVMVFFGFLALLTRADVSWVVPAAASTYVVDTVAAKYLLSEKVTRTRWAGVLCVCLGVTLISL